MIVKWAMIGLLYHLQHHDWMSNVWAGRCAYWRFERDSSVLIGRLVRANCGSEDSRDEEVLKKNKIKKNGNIRSRAFPLDGGVEGEGQQVLPAVVLSGEGTLIIG